MSGAPRRRLRAVPTTAGDPLTAYDDAFLVCREQHRWPLGDPALDHWDEEVDERGRLIGWRRVMMCERCHAITTDRLDLGGSFKRQTRLPKGYSIPRDTGGFISRGQVRRERIRRVVEQPRKDSSPPA